jgi:hypothetical protein
MKALFWFLVMACFAIAAALSPIEEGESNDNR